MSGSVKYPNGMPKSDIDTWIKVLREHVAAGGKLFKGELTADEIPDFQRAVKMRGAKSLVLQQEDGTAIVITDRPISEIWSALNEVEGDIELGGYTLDTLSTKKHALADQILEKHGFVVNGYTSSDFDLDTKIKEVNAELSVHGMRFIPVDQQFIDETRGAGARKYSYALSALKKRVRETEEGVTR